VKSRATIEVTVHANSKWQIIVVKPEKRVAEIASLAKPRKKETTAAWKLREA